MLVDNNTKLLNDSYNYDAIMPFEELLESFEEDCPFREAHSSSSLGQTIVIYNSATTESIINKLESGTLGSIHHTLVNKLLADSANGLLQDQSGDDTKSSTLGSELDADRLTTSNITAATTQTVAATTPQIFNHSCGLKFNYAVSGYAYHPSKNPPRKTIIDTLPQALFDPQVHSYTFQTNDESGVVPSAAAVTGEVHGGVSIDASTEVGPTKVSIFRGDHSPGDHSHKDGYIDGEYPLTEATLSLDATQLEPSEQLQDNQNIGQELQAKKCVYDVPVEAYDKIELRHVTSLGCGEDSAVGSSQLLALADGVSGWNTYVRGHAALWSRLFMHRTLSNFVNLFNSSTPVSLAALENGKEGSEGENKDGNGVTKVETNKTISHAIGKAFYETREILKDLDEAGSSTIVAAALDTVSQTAHFVSVGDSSVWVFRDREVIFTIEHGTKKGSPKQVGTHSTEIPSDIENPVSLEVLPGDVVLMCSDGLADNLFIGEITEQLFEAYDSVGGTGVGTEADSVDGDENVTLQAVQAAADALVALAVDRSFDNFAICPYQLSSPFFSAGGGKSDDISVVVAEVVKDER